MSPPLMSGKLILLDANIIIEHFKNVDGLDYESW